MGPDEIGLSMLFKYSQEGKTNVSPEASPRFGHQMTNHHPHEPIFLNISFYGGGPLQKIGPKHKAKLYEQIIHRSGGAWRLGTPKWNYAGPLSIHIFVTGAFRMRGLGTP
jgi:hypothetical protein